MMWCDSYSPIVFNTVPTCYVCGFHGQCKKEAATGVHSTGSGKGFGSSTQIPATKITEIRRGCKYE